MSSVSHASLPAITVEIQRNARESTASLARQLGVARTTVQERIRRLERDGVIAGDTVRVSESFARQRIAAQVLINGRPQSRRARGTRA
jgi:DNA-binding Lrp family transcriptional regulator